ARLQDFASVFAIEALVSFEYEHVRAALREQQSEHQPRGACPDDAHARSDGVHDRGGNFLSNLATASFRRLSFFSALSLMVSVATPRQMSCLEDASYTSTTSCPVRIVSTLTVPCPAQPGPLPHPFNCRRASTPA